MSEMATPVTVTLERVSKIFPSLQAGRPPVRAVAETNLEVRPGELLTLLGPSGCGKTTLLRMIAGFEDPTEGAIRFDGRRIDTLAPSARSAGMVFQSYALFPHLSVFDNVAFGLRVRGAGTEEVRRRVEEVLALVGLEGLGGRAPGRLSGGQQQRVALARAIVIQPRVLLFDEPLSNLDAKLREQMRGEVRDLQQRLGITSIYVTHDQSEAMAISDRIAVMKHGVIEQIGPPVSVYARPVNRFVADFLGKVAFLPARVEVLAGGVARVTSLDQVVGEIAPDGVPQGAVSLVLRPEAVRLRAESGWEARVVKVVYLGSSAEYLLALPGDRKVVAVESDPDPANLLEPGTETLVGVRPGRIHLLPAEAP
jgi:iron(III) transport system ATP-binding protein